MDDLEARVETLERTVTDGETDLSELSSEAKALERLADLETQCAEFESRLAELDAATQALRGYVGSIRSVNTEVEQRADAALAAVESLEQQLNTATEQKQGRQSTEKQSGHPVETEPDCCASCGRPQQKGTNSESPPEQTSPYRQTNETDTNEQKARAYRSECRSETRDNGNQQVAVSDGGASSDTERRFQESNALAGVSSQPQTGHSDHAKKPGTLARIRELL